MDHFGNLETSNRVILKLFQRIKYEGVVWIRLAQDIPVEICGE
jgi:hypothetical protein